MANNLLNNTVVSLRFQVALAGDRIFICAEPDKGTPGELEALQTIALLAGIFRRYRVPFKVYERNVGPEYINIPDAITITAIPSLNDFLDRLEHWETIGNLARG